MEDWQSIINTLSLKNKINNNKNIGIIVVVVVVVVHSVQTSSPLKLLGQSKPNFMWSLFGKGERKFI